MDLSSFYRGLLVLLFPKGGICFFSLNYFFQDSYHTQHYSTVFRDGMGQITTDFITDRINDEYEKEYEISSYYEHNLNEEDHVLKFELNYSGYDEKEDNHYDENYTAPGFYSAFHRILVKKGGHLAEFYAEYTCPIAEDGELEAGYTHTGLYNFKYTTHASRKSAVGSAELNWPINYHYIRFADVLLMAAELQLANGSSAKADEYVNMVRARVNMPALSSVTLDDIYAERRVELGLEGQRYWDLLRRGLSYAKQEIDITGYTIYPPMDTDSKYVDDKLQNLTGDVGVPSDFEVTFDSAKKGFLPIPQKELDLNENLVQNAGY